MKLHYQIVGEGEPLVILHGLFGSIDNWRGLAKELSLYAQVITVDLRNHGASPHSDEQTYQLMSEDLVTLFNHLKLEKINLMGHSVGGKVAMKFASTYPDRLNNLVIVDMSPRYYELDEGHISILHALLNIDLSLYSKRSEVDVVLAPSLPNKAIRQFLLMNLVSKQGVLTWRINLQSIYDNYANFGAAVCEQGSVDVHSCFINGGKSDYISTQDESLILRVFPKSQIQTIKSAGHWVHAEAPVEFLKCVKGFLAL